MRKQWSTRWLTRKQRWSGDNRRHTEICVATGRNGGRLSQSVVNTLVKSQAEVEAETLCDTLSDAQPMVHRLPDLRNHRSTRFLTL